MLHMYEKTKCGTALRIFTAWQNITFLTHAARPQELVQYSRLVRDCSRKLVLCKKSMPPV